MQTTILQFAISFLVFLSIIKPKIAFINYYLEEYGSTRKYLKTAIGSIDLPAIFVATLLLLLTIFNYYYENVLTIIFMVILPLILIWVVFVNENKIATKNMRYLAISMIFYLVVILIASLFGSSFATLLVTTSIFITMYIPFDHLLYKLLDAIGLKIIKIRKLDLLVVGDNKIINYFNARTLTNFTKYMLYKEIRETNAKILAAPLLPKGIDSDFIITTTFIDNTNKTIACNDETKIEQAITYGIDVKSKYMLEILDKKTDGSVVNITCDNKKIFLGFIAITDYYDLLDFLGVITYLHTSNKEEELKKMFLNHSIK